MGHILLPPSPSPLKDVVWVEATGTATRSRRPQPFLRDSVLGAHLDPSLFCYESGLSCPYEFACKTRGVFFAMLEESGCNEGFWRGEQL